MSASMKFDELLDAVDQLSTEERADFIRLVQHRQIETRREEIAADIAEAMKEYESGVLKPMTAAEIMREIKKDSSGNFVCSRGEELL